MNNANAKSASTKSTTISDAEMVSALANSNWAKMERDAVPLPPLKSPRTAIKIEIVAPVIQ
jgi:hypothetical protein